MLSLNMLNWQITVYGVVGIHDNNIIRYANCRKGYIYFFKLRRFHAIYITYLFLVHSKHVVMDIFLSWLFQYIHAPKYVSVGVLVIVENQLYKLYRAVFSDQRTTCRLYMVCLNVHNAQ